jgi:hypothetical protein
VKLPGAPFEQAEVESCQPACVVSAMLNVFVGSMFANVCVAVEADVVSVVLLSPPLPVVVNANEPLPPVVYLTSTMVACFVFVNVQVTVAPAVTVKLAGAPLEHVEFASCQPACAVSAMLNVCVGSMFVNVCVAVEADVVSVVLLNPPAPVVVNANDPLPPVVVLVRTMDDCFTLSNVQVIVLPAVTVNPVTVPLAWPTQTGAAPVCQPACVASVML